MVNKSEKSQSEFLIDELESKLAAIHERFNQVVGNLATRGVGSESEFLAFYAELQETIALCEDQSATNLRFVGLRNEFDNWLSAMSKAADEFELELPIPEKPEVDKVEESEPGLDEQKDATSESDEDSDAEPDSDELKEPDIEALESEIQEESADEPTQTTITHSDEEKISRRGLFRRLRPKTSAPKQPETPAEPDQDQDKPKKKNKLSRRKFLIGAGLAGGATLAAAFLGKRSLNKQPEVLEQPDTISQVLPETSKTPEAQHFKTCQEAGKYILQQEHQRGWSDRELPNSADEMEELSEDFYAERESIRGPEGNRRRTVAFVISEECLQDIVDKWNPEFRGDKLEFFTRHVQYLNDLYAQAGVDLQYSLEEIIVLPESELQQERTDNHIHHQHKKGIQFSKGFVPYARYVDSTWVLTQKDAMFDRSSDNFVDRLVQHANYDPSVDLPTANGIDRDIIHELIHHTGLRDWYMHDRDFDHVFTLPFMSYISNDYGYMSGSKLVKISGAERVVLNRLLSNNTYSPQHDGEDTSRIQKSYYHFRFSPEDYICSLSTKDGIPISLSNVEFFSCFDYVHPDLSGRKSSVDPKHPFEINTDTSSILLSSEKVIELFSNGLAPDKAHVSTFMIRSRIEHSENEFILFIDWHFLSLLYIEAENLGQASEPIPIKITIMDDLPSEKTIQHLNTVHNSELNSDNTPPDSLLNGSITTRPQKVYAQMTFGQFTAFWTYDVENTEDA